jgi:hypothetical protein
LGQFANGRREGDDGCHQIKSANVHDRAGRAFNGYVLLAFWSEVMWSLLDSTRVRAVEC